MPDALCRLGVVACGTESSNPLPVTGESANVPVPKTHPSSRTPAHPRGIDEGLSAKLLAIISLLVRGGGILLPSLIENALLCSLNVVHRIGRVDAASSVCKNPSDSAGPLFSNGGVGIASRRSKRCFTTPRRAC
jgi:hypothetical protein